MRKNVILSSVMSLVLCLSLIVGGTFALFTSADQTNISINSGNVEVVAEVTDLKLYSHADIDMNTEVGTKTYVTDTFLNGGTAAYAGKQLTLSKLTPGDGVEFNISVENKSNVDIKYRVLISGTTGDAKLMEGLAVTIDGKDYVGAVNGDWTDLEAEGTIPAIRVTVELPTTAGDEYQDLTVALSVAVEAVQGNAVEHIDVYDPDEPYEDTLDNVIDSAAEFVAFANAVNAGNTYAGETVTLATSIDLNGAAWTAINNFAGTFDGQNYTVSNLTANLFGTVSGTVKNLNVKNVTVTNTTKGGANGFIGTLAEGGLVDNCDVSGVDIQWADGLTDMADCFGGIISRVNTGATVQNCEFTDITLTAYEYFKRSSPVFAEVSGKISGCIVDGVIFTVVNEDKATGNAYTNQVGGIIADLYSSAEVIDCDFNNIVMTIDRANNTGGVIGKAYVTGTSGPCEITLKDITINNLTMNIGNTIYANKSISNVGGFIGQMDSRNNDSHLTMSNCHINGLDMTLASNKKGEDPSGGFIASLNGGADITNCSVDGKINGTNEPIGIGGFLGTIGGYGANNDYVINITDCAANVAITGNDNIFVGGFVAHAGSYNQTMTKNLALNFTNCEATGSFYGVKDTNETEVCTFTGCKVDGADFAG